MVRMDNSAVYAMQVLQQEMTGEAERTGLISEVRTKRQEVFEHLTNKDSGSRVKKLPARCLFIFRFLTSSTAPAPDKTPDRRYPRSQRL